MFFLFRLFKKNKKKKKNRAQTLLELIVVVIIIAILVSIALPKYTKSIEKQKAMKSMNMLQYLSDSAKRYSWMNNEWTHDFRDLDITIPGGEIGGAEIPGRPYGNIATNNFYYIFTPNKKGIYVVRTNENTSFGYYMFLIYLETNLMDCMVEDIDKGKPICEYFGSTEDYYKYKNISLPFGGNAKVYYYRLY